MLSEHPQSTLLNIQKAILNGYLNKTFYYTETATYPLMIIGTIEEAVDFLVDAASKYSKKYGSNLNIDSVHMFYQKYDGKKTISALAVSWYAGDAKRNSSGILSQKVFERHIFKSISDNEYVVGASHDDLPIGAFDYHSNKPIGTFGSEKIFQLRFKELNR